MAWFHWVVGIMVALTGGWMAFDGAWYFVKGDYVTPGGGGELGPWSHVVSAVGLTPRSTLMASIFIVYGIAWLASFAGWLWRPELGWWPLLLTALTTLWYLPIGTVTALGTAILLFLHRP